MLIEVIYIFYCIILTCILYMYNNRIFIIILLVIPLILFCLLLNVKYTYNIAVLFLYQLFMLIFYSLSFLHKNVYDDFVKTAPMWFALGVIATLLPV